jgi:hypothetical protein
MNDYVNPVRFINKQKRLWRYTREEMSWFFNSRGLNTKKDNSYKGQIK